MTREGLNKHWEVIKAFKEGRDVQRLDGIGKKWWTDTELPSFSIENTYRIKPKEPIKLVPGKSYETNNKQMSYERELVAILDPRVRAVLNYSIPSCLVFLATYNDKNYFKVEVLPVILVFHNKNVETYITKEL